MRVVLLSIAICGMTLFAAEPRSLTSQASVGSTPESGPLGEHELILLAIQKRPELERLRGSVAVATAEKRAAGDLENPELRFSYAEDVDTRIGEPYTERETVITQSTENFSSTSSTTDLGLPGESVLNRESGTVRTSRFREIERRVTPGATEDVIEERIYETSDSASSSGRLRTENDPKNGTLTTPQARNARTSRRLVGTNRRVIQHPDASGRDNAWALLLRLRLPHPWERKARIQRAAAEISLAEASYYAEEDKVVRTVRAAFHELALLQAELAVQATRKAEHETYRDWLESQRLPQLGLDLAGARLKALESLNSIRKLETAVSSVKNELAAYCGVTKPERITTGKLARRIVSPKTLDVSYLESIALLYRSDLLSNQARLNVAKAQLSQSRAALIPFATFLDLGYTQMNSLRRTGQNEEWFLRLGVTLPIWEWTGINKQRKAREAATKTLEGELALQRKKITEDVTVAIKRLVDAEQQIARFDKDIASLDGEMKKAAADSEVAAADINGLAKAKKIEHDYKSLKQDMEIGRFQAFSAYQEALMALEAAIGTRIERALSIGSGQ